MKNDNNRRIPRLNRRSLIKGIGAGSLLPLLGGNLLGCSDGSDRREDTSTPIDIIPAQFNHGVASGDPLEDRVILWTRVTPERDGEVFVTWEVATDADFSDIVASGEGSTSAAVDYTVKVDANGLQSGAGYYYRFAVAGTRSPTGQTRTVPAGMVTAASLAVVSCSNYPAGFFHVYREVANQTVDAVLHLGDYLYEYDRAGYASEQAADLDREVEPATELLSLADYRRRYAQYHTDADLQACHAAHPFIVVWDDHEVANDAWREGAENHTSATEGDYSDRQAAAIQAWYEWLPVRPPASEREIIYRRFQYGDLVDLLMLDTRHIGRDRQVDYGEFVNGGLIDTDAVRAAVGDSMRTLLGETQREWLKSRLSDSTARWQVLGQQVLMARQPMPEPVVRSLTPALAGDNALAEATAAVLTTIAAKNKPPADRTPEEQALLDSVIPFNPDAWDGYAFEREAILTHASQLQSRLVVLAGDTHNAWASQLTLDDGQVVGVELAAPSVSSPGAEAVLGDDTAVAFGQLAPALIDDLAYANLTSRGYLQLDFTPDQVDARWQFVTAIDTVDYSIDEAMESQYTVIRDNLLLS
jgi:alkaline phosphatase D